jgi:molybdate transport system permease protein
MTDWTPVWLTLKLAGATTVLLFALALPLAWWLANTRSRLKPVVEAVTALPLVLPPTVLGFYLLILMNPEAPLGAAFRAVTGQTLTFSFTGLVAASMLYSLPFAVQPIQGGFQSVGRGLIEAARTLGATPGDVFRTIALPLARRGLLTAAVLTFAHTLGEFGVVLMVGGSIPGETRTVSIAIYDRVQAFDQPAAAAMALTLLLIAVVALAATYSLARRIAHR